MGSCKICHFSAWFTLLISVHFLWPLSLASHELLPLAVSGVDVWPIQREDCYLLNPRQQIQKCCAFPRGFLSWHQLALRLLTRWELELVAQPASCIPEQVLSFPGSSSHLQCKAESWSSPVTWASGCSLLILRESAGVGGILSYISTVKKYFYCLECQKILTLLLVVSGEQERQGWCVFFDVHVLCKQGLHPAGRHANSQINIL